MNTIESISLICSSNFRPSTKIGLITLLIEEKPLTTADLNEILNLNKTFENYKTLFNEQISAGIIELVPLKSRGGKKRIHFELNSSALINSLK